MAWTLPRTWVAGEVTSAAVFNQHVRDNLLALHDNRVSSLPGSPTDQDECTYLADASNRCLWRLKYNVGGPAGKQWEFCGGSPLVAVNDGSTGNVNSLAYAPLPTPVQVVVPLAGEYVARYWVRQASDGGSGWTSSFAPKFGSSAVVDNESVSKPVAGISGLGMALAAETTVHTLALSDVVALQSKQSTASAAGSIVGAGLAVTPRRVG